MSFIPFDFKRPGDTSNPRVSFTPSEKYCEFDFQTDKELATEFISKTVDFERGVIPKDKFRENLNNWFPLFFQPHSPHAQMTIMVPQSLSHLVIPKTPVPPVRSVKHLTISRPTRDHRDSLVPAIAKPKKEIDIRKYCREVVEDASIPVNKIRQFWLKPSTLTPLTFNKSFFFVHKLKEENFVLEYIDLKIATFSRR